MQSILIYRISLNHKSFTFDLLSYNHLNQYSFNNSRKIPKSAQLIPRIYNKIIIKILGHFWGVTSRTLNIRFDQALTLYGFEKSHDEPCVYKRIQGTKVVFLVLYVDDILLIGNDIEVLSSVKGCKSNLI